MDPADYAAWCRRTAGVLGWTKPPALARFVEWYRGFRQRGVTLAELHAATDDLAARTVSLMPTDVLPTINASIRRRRAEREAAAKAAADQARRAGPTPEEEAEYQRAADMLRRRRAGVG